MSVNGDVETIAVKASADLSGVQYKAVQIDGTLATGKNNAAGILQNKPKSGEHATIAYLGHMKAVAGAALSVGSAFTIGTSGYLVTPSSGDDGKGRVVTAASSGALCEVIANFLNPQITA